MPLERTRIVRQGVSCSTEPLPLFASVFIALFERGWLPRLLTFSWFLVTIDQTTFEVMYVLFSGRTILKSTWTSTLPHCAQAILIGCAGLLHVLVRSAQARLTDEQSSLQEQQRRLVLSLGVCEVS